MSLIIESGGFYFDSSIPDEDEVQHQTKERTLEAIESGFLVLSLTVMCLALMLYIYLYVCVCMCIRC